MATIMDTVVTITYGLPDAAAAGSATALAVMGLPDTVDVAAVTMPQAGAVTGITVIGSPASGDSVVCSANICTDKTGAGSTTVAGLSATITNAAPAASAIVTKDTPSAQFKAGQAIQVAYTTISGSYTPRDLVVIVYVQLGLEDI